ncbi:MAG: hypothetical protein ABFD57_08620 [Smithella sp.]
MKKWITWEELCSRWDITKRDLTDMVNEGKFLAFYENDGTCLYVCTDGYYREDFGFRYEPITVDEVTNELIFRISDIEKFEKKQGISPNWEQRNGEIGKKTYENSFDDAVKLSKQDEEINLLRQKIQSQEGPKEVPIPISSKNKANYENAFIRQSEFWEIWFHGKKLLPIKNLDGIHYIAILLDKAGTSISCRELYQVASGKTPDNCMSENAAIDEGFNIGSITQAVSDSTTKLAYATLYQELQNDFKNAESVMEQQEIEQEMATILPCLKEKTFVDPNDKKAQVNVGKRLKTAYAAIHKANMDELEKHLRTYIKPDDAYGLGYTGSLTWDITL